MSTAVLPISIRLVDAPVDLRGFRTRTARFVDALGELFVLELEGLLPDPDLDLATIAGARAEVTLPGQPVVSTIGGIVVLAEQRSSIARGASSYALAVGPVEWLMTQRRDCRIFQGLSIPEVVAAVCADPSYANRIAPPVSRLSGAPTVREYCVQYDETDWAFVTRILAEEGFACFFDHQEGGAFTLVEDTSLGAPETKRVLPYREDARLAATAESALAEPYVSRVATAFAPRTSVVTLRDYDFEKPAFPLGASATTAETPYSNEVPLEQYGYAPGRFSDPGRGVRSATAILASARDDRLVLRATTNFVAPVGYVMAIEGAPRADVAGELVVSRSAMFMTAEGDMSFELDGVRRARRYVPPARPKARIFGTQTATVVGAPGEEITVDASGRVEVEFRWDRRDTHTAGASRWVRVSQPWAGNAFGMVLLPRVGDEVVVSYLDGDPEQPLIVGRVHNAARVSPLNLPAEKTQSVWRSQSSPGGAGFNEIRMEDKAGEEVLSFTAQRDLVEKVGRHVSRTVAGNETSQIHGNNGGKVLGDQSLDVSGNESVHVGGDYAITADGSFSVSSPKVDITGSALVHIATGGERLDESAMHLIRTAVFNIIASANTVVTTPIFAVKADVISLKAGGSSITLTDGGVQIESSGAVEVHGKPIKLNC